MALSPKDQDELIAYSIIAFLLVVGFWMLAVSGARGQVAPANDPQTYSFTFTAQDVNAIEAGLNELPRKLSEPVIQRMQNQARAIAETRAKQMTEKAKADAEANEKAKAKPFLDGVPALDGPKPPG